MRDDLLKQRLVEHARVAHAEAVVDLGCGTATLTTMIKRASPDLDVRGVDIDRIVLARA